MRQKSVSTASTPEKLVRDIRRATRKQYSAEEKIRIVKKIHLEIAFDEFSAPAIQIVWVKKDHFGDHFSPHVLFLE
jgi:hypothetical protein